MDIVFQLYVRWMLNWLQVSRNKRSQLVKGIIIPEATVCLKQLLIVVGKNKGTNKC